MNTGHRHNRAFLAASSGSSHKLNGRRWRILLAATVAAAGVGNFLGTAQAGTDTSATFSTTATDLSVGTNYTPNINPLLGNTSDIVLAGPFTGGTTFTVNGSALNFGTLDDTDTIDSLIISNGCTTAGSISLNTPQNNVSGTTADILYVKAGGNLTIQSGTGNLSLSVPTTGNFDVAGTLSIASPINLTSGQQLGFTGVGNSLVSGVLSGPGVYLINDSGGNVTFSAANTYTGNTSVNSGTLYLTGAATLGNGTVSSLVITAASNAGRLDLGGTSQTVKAVAIQTPAPAGYDTIQNGNITAGNYTATNGIRNAIVTANLAGGAGGLLENGSGGILTLQGNNTYTGATTITAGTLSVGNAFNLGNVSSNLVFNGGTLQVTGTTIGNFTSTGHTVVFNTGKLVTLDINNATNVFTVDDVLNQTTGGLTKLGAGTAILSQANTYTGATTITAGNLSIQNAGAFGPGAGTVSVASGTALQIQGNISTTNAIALNLKGNGVTGNGALENVSGNNTYTGLVTLGAAATIGSDAGTLNLSNTGTITGATFGLTLAGAGNGNISSIIGTTTGTLTMAGTGTWTLAGTNTYTGLTTVSAGTLAVNGSGRLGNGSSPVTMAGGTLDLGGGNQSVSTLTISAGPAGGNTIQNGNLTATAFTPSLNTGTAVVTANLILGTSAISLTGPATVTLAGNTTYAGATLVSGGTLNLGNGTGVGSISSSGLTIGGSSGNYYGGGALNFTTAGTDTLTFPTTTLGNGASAIYVGSANDTIALGTITRNGGTIDFSGNGTMTAAVAGSGTSHLLNSYNVAYATVGGNDWAATGSLSGSVYPIVGLATLGGYTLGGSTSFATNANIDVALGNTATSLSGNTTIEGLRFNQPQATTISIGSNGNLSLYGVLVTSNVGNNSSIITGGNFVPASANANYSLTVVQNNPSGNLTIASVITDGTGSVGLTKSGNGTLVLTGNNTYTGATDINAGTLTLGGSGTLGATGKTLSMSGGTLDLGGGNQSVGAIAISAPQASGAYTIQNGNLTGTSLTTTFLAGNATISANLNLGSGAVTESANAGTLILTGNNTFSGGVTLSHGANIFAQSSGALGSGTVTVTYGDAQLQGNITLANAMSLQGNAGFDSLENISGNNTVSGLLTFSNKTQIGSDAGMLNLTNTGNITSSYGPTFVGAGIGSFAENMTVTSGGLTKTGSGAWMVSGNNSFNASPGISVSGGTLILTGANTYTQATTLSAGALQLGTGGSLGNTSLTMSAGTTFLANAGTSVSSLSTGTTFTMNGGAAAGPTLSLADGTIGNFTIGGTLSLISGSVMPAFKFDIGNGTTDQLKVNLITFGGGANTITLNPISSSLAAGNFTLISDATTTNLPAYWALSSGSITVSGTTYALSLANSTNMAEILTVTAPSYSGPPTWTGNGNNSWDTSTANWITASGALYADGMNVVFDDTGNNTNPVNITAGGVNPGSLTFNNNAKTYAFTGGQIGGNSTTLTLNGNGTVILLNGANTYAGNTTINAGTLQLGNGTSGYDASVAGNVINNATLAFNLYGNQTVAGAISGNGTTTVNGTGAVAVGSFTQANLVNNGAITLTSTGTVATAISGNGTTTVGGAGSLTVGNFSQTGLVNNGTAQINGAGAIGQLTGSGNLTIGTGSSNNTVQLTSNALPNSFIHTQQAITISSGSTLDITNNTLLLNYGSGSTPLAAVLAAVANGTLTSSTISTGGSGQYAVGYADATELGSIASGNVEVMFTLGGDANLDSAVNFNDYSTLQNYYNQTGTDWAQGDFNHDGTTNFNDYSILQNNYGQTLAGVVSGSAIIKGAKSLTKTSGSGTIVGAALAANSLTKLSSSIAPAIAPTVTYVLSVNDDGTGHYSAGHYAVYASDSTNNGGLASYDISLAGTKTLTNYSPKGNYDDGSGCGTDDEMGFVGLRSANNASPATGTQDTAGYAGGSGVILVYGFGQTAGNLGTKTNPGSTGADGSTTQAVYGAPLELVRGTFTSAAPTFASTGTDTGNVFLTTTGYGTEAPTLAFSTVTLPSGVAHSALLTITATGSASPSYIGTSNPGGNGNSSTITVVNTGVGYYIPGLLNGINAGNATRGAAKISGFSGTDAEIIAVAISVTDAGNGTLHTPSAQELADIITDLNASPSLPGGATVTVEAYNGTTAGTLQHDNLAAFTLLNTFESNYGGQALELAVLVSGVTPPGTETFGLNFASESVDGITAVEVTDIAVVPEPASMSLLLLGGLPLLNRRRRRS